MVGLNTPMQYMSINIFLTCLSMYFCSNPQNKAKENKIDKETKNIGLQNQLTEFELISNTCLLYLGLG